MRKETITTTYNIYTFEELPADVQEAVIEKYINNTIDGRNDWFYEDCKNALSELLPNSDASVQYSLSYCQGDGLEIYGEISWADLLEAVKNEMTDKEVKTICHYLEEANRCIKLEPNRHYCYYHHKAETFADDLEDALYYSNYANINHEAIETFSILCNDYLKELCGNWEKAGYEELYSPAPDYIKEELTQHEYLEDGSMYN